MPASPHSRQGQRDRKSPATGAVQHAPTEDLSRTPFWGWTDLALWLGGMLLLIVCLYQIVLNFGLTAKVAGAITDVPGPLGILYFILPWRYRRSPWAALGWVLPHQPLYWALAVVGGSALGLLVMSVENPTRTQIHFHTTAEALLFSVVFAGLIEETSWRGAILPVLMRYSQPFTAAFLTGIVFALSHSLYRGRLPSLSTLGWATLTGTAYGLLRIRSQSTLTAAVMHACYNLTLFVWQGA